MRDELAERLLAKVMGWGAAEVAAEVAILQDMARLKYDEYQQFSPGARFIESLALWLRQFRPEERAAAYAFVRKRLLFFSAAEMRLLVGAAFPTLIRPKLLGLAAQAENMSPDRIKAIMRSTSYKALRRRTLYLGLSDGAATDVFRRANPEDISNEQIWHAYDFSEEKAQDLGAKLSRDLKKLYGRDPTREESRFQLVCLLDDFTASGKSYLRTEKSGAMGGKIARIFERLRQTDGALAPFLDLDRLDVMVVIYVAAAQAIDQIEAQIPSLRVGGESIALHVVRRLPPAVRLEDGRDDAILNLARLDRYFDPEAHTDATRVGGEDVRLGFADGRLPLVLSHNTPINSLYLLWAEPWHKVRGLFPRVSRHRDFG